MIDKKIEELIESALEEAFYKGNLVKTPGLAKEGITTAKRQAAANMLKEMRKSTKVQGQDRPQSVKKAVKSLADEKLQKFDQA